jgi:Golgi nucleoside diphosphatase
MATATKTEKKEKKEKKFNSERTSRQVKKALGAVFPKDNPVVSYFTDRVEIMVTETNTISVLELNTFCAIFCSLTGTKKEQLQLFKVKKELVTTPAPAPVK